MVLFQPPFYLMLSPFYFHKRGKKRAYFSPFSPKYYSVKKYDV